MNQYSIIESINGLTKHWTLEDWSVFRDAEYWRIKDNFHKHWFNKKTNKWDSPVYYRFLKWKLERIMNYLE